MCSYVNDWSINNKMFNYLKKFFEKIAMCFMYLLIYFKNIIHDNFENTFVYKIISKIVQDIFIIFLETYCL